MIGSVPGDVHEADEGAGISGADPAETVFTCLLPPVVLTGLVREAFRVQRGNLAVAERPAPLVDDHCSNVAPGLCQGS